MIYNDRFVWLHFPKCAGTTVENIFAKYYASDASIHQDPVGLELDPSVGWHDTIQQRQAKEFEFELGNRIVICPFRRLIPWLVSRYTFELTRSPHLPHSIELLSSARFYESSGQLNHAETYARAYLPPELIKMNRVRFIRTEFFADDFKLAFGDLIDLSLIPLAELSKKHNSQRTSPPQNLSQYLDNQIASVYGNCPYWRGIEQIAYSKDCNEPSA